MNLCEETVISLLKKLLFPILIIFEKNHILKSGMQVNYIALSIPVFFILIGIEVLYDFYSHRHLYRLNDSISNISQGIGQQVTGVFLKTVMFYGYLFLYEHFRIFFVEPTLLNWILLFVALDFFYYWFHRLSHEINLLWAAHIVHHQSEEYNLSVALRQSWFQGIFSSVFYLPLALIGFNPIMFVTISSFNTLYQFWIHTRVIGKLGPLEWIFNTPSHHRVHHGSNPKYIDKNHGGTLIVWDRIFGTFQEEEEEPFYGITHPLNSWNPVWANLHYWSELFSSAGKTLLLKNKILLFLKPPGWFPAELGGIQSPPEIVAARYRKYDFDNSKSLHPYILIHFVIVLLAATGILFFEKQLGMWKVAAIGFFVVHGLLNFGALFEGKRWIQTSEFLRLVLMVLLAIYIFPGNFYLATSGALVVSGVSVFVLKKGRTKEI